jgi:hypothetical protein
VPIILGSLSAVLCYKYKTEIQNAFLGSRVALKLSEERFVAKRISGFLKYTYVHGKQPLSNDLIEVQLCEELYKYILAFY